MQRAGIALVLALTLLAGCSDDSGSDPFEALSADQNLVTEYEIAVEERQSSERRWVRIDVASWGEGVAAAVAADYLTENQPDEAETVINVRFDDQPAFGCNLFWPDDDRNTGCP